MEYQYKLFEMNRNEYIELRENNHIGNIMYEYYKEKRDTSKRELTPQEFTVAYNSWHSVIDYTGITVDYYNHKFGITEAIKLKDNKVIKII